MAKSYCYRDSCEFVQTGFQWNDWVVCRVCKEEVTEALCKRKTEEQERARKIEQRNKELRDSDSSDEDPYAAWQFM
jgi:hypothetical protein